MAVAARPLFRIGAPREIPQRLQGFTAPPSRFDADRSVMVTMMEGQACRMASGIKADGSGISSDRLAHQFICCWHIGCSLGCALYDRAATARLRAP